MKYIIKEQVLIAYLKVVVKIKEGRLDLSSSHFYFILFSIYFSIFRKTRVRVDQLHCHISHNLMAKSQDKSRNLEELSRRFWNK